MYRNWFWLLAASGCTPALGLLPAEPVGPSHAGVLGTDFVYTHRPLVADLGSAWEGVGGGLRAWLLPDRVVAVDRLASEPGWAISLRTDRWGRGEVLAPVAPGRTAVDGARFESRRPDFTEWFETTPSGIEQGYTLRQRPSGDGPVVIELAVDGGEVRPTARGVRIAAGGGGVDWTGLVAWDADQQLLSARLLTSADRIRIEVDDAGARWPVTVDPLISVVEDTVTSTDLNGGFPSWLGYSIDSQGDRLIVGDPGDPLTGVDGEGLAWVVRPTVLAGGWQNEEILDPTIATPQAADQDFGQSVAIEGRHAAVAGPHANVYFFTQFESSGWEEQSLGSAGSAASPVVVDLADEIAVIGLPGVGGNGAVSLYTPYPGTVLGWHFFQSFNSANPLSKLGFSVSATSGRFAAGDPWLEQVRVHRRDTDDDDGDPNTFYYQTATLDSPAANDSEFGFSVSMTPTRIAVGAPGTNEVYVYTLVNGNTIVNPSTIPQDSWGTPLVIDAPSWSGERFGSSVALYGNSLLISDLPADGDARVYRYEYSAPGVWEIREGLEMGRTPGVVPLPVTVNAGLIAAGAPERLDEDGEPLDARFRVWRRTGDAFTTSGLPLLGPAAAEFGTAVAMEDRLIAVGSPYADSFIFNPFPIPATNVPDAGRVDIYARGAGTDWTLANAILRIGPGADAHLGSAVALDGERVLVGAPDAFDGLNANGNAYLYRITGTGPVVEERQFASEGTNSNFGASVGLDGTIAAIGQPAWNGVGRAVVYAYAPLDDEWVEMGTAPGTTADDGLGDTVAVSGGRVFVGSGRFDRNAVNDGVVQIFEVVHDTLTIERRQSFSGAAAGDRFGSAFDVEGDLLAVGAWGTSNGRGEVVVYEWDTTNYVERQRIQPANIAVGSNFGSTVSVAGGRIYVGAPGNGKVYTYVRDPDQGDTWILLDSFVAQTDTVAGDDNVMVTADVANSTVTSWLLEGDGPPVARADSLQATEDTEGFLSGNVLENDTDPDGDLLTVTGVESNGVGELEIDADGGVHYTPEPDAVGLQVFTYTLSDGTHEVEGRIDVQVANVNDAPVANPDPDPSLPPYETDENVTLTMPANIGVLYNDTDIDVPTTLRAILTTPPMPSNEGSVVLRTDGSFDFTPAADYIGSTGFWYFVRDSTAANAGQSEPAWVELVVNATNVAPEALVDDIEWASITEYEQFSLGRPGLLSSDYVIDEDADEGDVLHVELRTPPLYGFLRLEPTGEVLYTPHTPGIDEFEFVVVDSAGEESEVIEVHITVEDVPDPPVAYPDRIFDTPEDVPLRIEASDLVLNDTDIDSFDGLRVALDASVVPVQGEIVADANGDLVYTPAPDSNGSDAFAYVAIDSDGNRSNPIRVDVRVDPVNDAPHAADQDLGGIQGTATGNVFSDPRSYDPENQAMTVTLLTSPPARKGEVTIDPLTGAFTYVPFEGASRADQFLYVLTDSEGAISSPGTIRLYVDLPDGVDPTEPTTGPCEILTFYADADGDGFGNSELSYAECTAPPGFVLVADDCDDTLPERYPGALEIGGDGIDQDCDGVDNTAVPVGACATTSANGTFGLLLLTLLGLRRRRTS